MHDSGEGNLDLVTSLNDFTIKLKEWNPKVFGNIFYRKKKCLQYLRGIQKALNGGRNQFLHRLELDLTKEYTQILTQEEIFWYRKSRCQWISFGDKNSS
jgi:hypothetical protein|uniref:Exocyst subunit Exo70 family protein n=1 Tax=Populus trichocarpa TaxID=3694 RepID=A0A3N7EKX2_POPTR